MKTHRRLGLIVVFVLGASLVLAQQPAANESSLEQLASDFWAWRAQHAPFSGDDVNRMERPGGLRDWSRAKIEDRLKALADFEERWQRFEVKSWAVPKQVDYRLIGSALSRVRWELEGNPRWKRDPNFYIEQTLTPVVEALTVPGPYETARSTEILARIENIPAILEQARENLDQPPAPFASVASEALRDIGPRLRKMTTSLVAATTLDKEKLNDASERAADGLDQFRQHLEAILPSLPAKTALGRDAYVFFLRNVALMPYSPEDLLAMGRQEWNRAVAFEAYEKNRNKDVPPLPRAKEIESWSRNTAAKELSIREFLEKRGILTVPD